MSDEVSKVLLDIHNANVESHKPVDNILIDLCYQCKSEKARFYCHVCDFGRCMDCFSNGSKISCGYCKELRRQSRV